MSQAVASRVLERAGSERRRKRMQPLLERMAPLATAALLLETLLAVGFAFLSYRILDEVRDLGTTMKGLSACGLGMAAPLLTESLVRYWPDQVERHVREANP